MTRSALVFVLAALAGVGAWLLATSVGPELGPVDGAGLSPADTGRVTLDDLAPDFTLASLGGDPVTLSDFRGQKDVVLVFYRGYW